MNITNLLHISDSNLLTQTLVVGVIVLVAIIWLVKKVFIINRGKNKSACMGCALSDKCTQKDRKASDCNKVKKQ